MIGPRTTGRVVRRYGPAPDQFLELTLPDDPVDARPPVVVVVHGGFWKAAYGVELARPLAADLAAAGYAAVAVEYRRVGAGGGWPATLTDVAAALDALPGLPEADELDLARVAVVGHSAGGHLAVWLAARHRLPPGAPGAGPVVRPVAAVSQAGVLDLARAHAQGMGDDAVRGFLGAGPQEAPERYAAADPVRLLPTGVPVLCVHGEDDDDVAPEQSERYAAAARAAGDAVDVRWVPGDHMDVVDPAGEAWRLTREWVTVHLRTGGGRPTLGT